MIAISAAFCFGKLKSPVDIHGIAIDSILFFSASANTERYDLIKRSSSIGVTWFPIFGPTVWITKAEGRL